MGTLIDAGPLAALVDSRQPQHARCVASLSGLPTPLVTTWPCVAEAMYLLGRILRWNGQQALWSLLTDGRLAVHTAQPVELARMRNLMERYKDVPMDLADASLVSAAEVLETSVVFTLDSDFYVYRLPNKRSFQVMPGA